jgi:hypothetical protein
MLLLVLLIPQVWSQDQDALGGVVIAQLSTGDVTRFIGSPSIVILEDGTYLASHDFFTDDSPQTYETRVFRSMDRGQSWVGVSTVNNLGWATLFTHGGLVYIMGTNREGNNVIRHSTNQGNSWGAGHGIGNRPNNTPSPPVIYHDRIWFAARGGTGAISAPLTANLLDPDAWTYTHHVSTEGSETWLNGTFDSWSEGQIVASPHTGVVALPKIHGLPYTARIHMSGLLGEPLEQAAFNPDTGFARLPGAEKKFACVYDAVSQKFYALTNPVLSVHANDPFWKPELIRNAGVVLSSMDLKTWRVEKIFLYSPNIDREAFQYFNFVIDGDDLAVVSRTALQVGSQWPPRGHDSNILSFHRITNFRQLTREQVLVADTESNRVLRYEANLTPRLAPLDTFDERNLAAMTQPMGVAQSPDGDVYISERKAGGRVLRFSASGLVFKEVMATEGVDFTGWPESLAFGEEGYLFMTVALGPDSDKIYRIDPSTKRVTLVVPSSFSSSAGRGTLRDPHGIALGPDGRLYVADRGNDKIRIFFRGTGEFLGDLTSQPSPLALALHPTGQHLLFSRRTTKFGCLPQHPCYTDDIIAQVYPGGDVVIRYPGSDLSMVLDSPIGQALGVQSLAGRVYWTDSKQGAIYVARPHLTKYRSYPGPYHRFRPHLSLRGPGNMARVLVYLTGVGDL